VGMQLGRFGEGGRFGHDKGGNIQVKGNAASGLNYSASLDFSDNGTDEPPGRSFQACREVAENMEE
jgi:hypothetical protein